jgi:hypothetical protein
LEISKLNKDKDELLKKQATLTKENDALEKQLELLDEKFEQA